MVKNTESADLESSLDLESAVDALIFVMKFMKLKSNIANVVQELKSD